MEEPKTVLTCVYCGQEYPAGTPASGSDVDALTSHIKICEKHPMRAAEENILELEQTARLLREQIRVADVAYQHLHEEHQKLEAAIREKDAVIRMHIKWHIDYDEYGGWPDSELATKSYNAISLTSGYSLLNRLEEAEGILRLMSTTADGKPAIPGSKLYLYPNGDASRPVMTVDVPPAVNYCWYSSEEAAKDALKWKEDENDQR